MSEKSWTVVSRSKPRKMKNSELKVEAKIKTNYFEKLKDLYNSDTSWKPRKVCKNIDNVKCQYGSKCRYSHVPTWSFAEYFIQSLKVEQKTLDDIDYVIVKTPCPKDGIRKLFKASLANIAHIFFVDMDCSEPQWSLKHSPDSIHCKDGSFWKKRETEFCWNTDDYEYCRVQDELTFDLDHNSLK